MRVGKAFLSHACFDAGKVVVRGPLSRLATLTHDDFTRVRTISAGHFIACPFMRDEVLIDALPDAVELRCHVSGGHSFMHARMRTAVFTSHMPAVIHAVLVAYGDAVDLNARIVVVFESHGTSTSEDWGAAREWRADDSLCELE